MARLSTPLSSFFDPKFEKIGVAESLEHLRLKLMHSGEPAVIAVEEDGSIAGVATKSSLLATIPYALILVDHNELGQAVPGAESVEILEVIDHHKLGNPPTNQPITFMAAPVGSTCTVVATLYRERGMEPEQPIAALLLAGILTDTVILKSPTTTNRDREMVVWLEQRSGLEHTAFGKEIFSSCSGFSAYDTPEKAVRADFKHFNAGETLFGVGQVEVVGFDEFYELKEELREALKRIKKQDRLDLAGLMITDIYTETSLLSCGREERVGPRHGLHPTGAASLRTERGHVAQETDGAPSPQGTGGALRAAPSATSITIKGERPAGLSPFCIQAGLAFISQFPAIPHQTAGLHWAE